MDPNQRKTLWVTQENSNWNCKKHTTEMRGNVWLKIKKGYIFVTYWEFHHTNAWGQRCTSFCSSFCCRRYYHSKVWRLAGLKPWISEKGESQNIQLSCYAWWQFVGFHHPFWDYWRLIGESKLQQLVMEQVPKCFNKTFIREAESTQKLQHAFCFGRGFDEDSIVSVLEPICHFIMMQYAIFKVKFE